MVNPGDLEKVAEKICDEYCRFPYILTDPEELSDTCEECPLCKLVESVRKITDISELGLSVRAYHVLKRNGIDSVEELKVVYDSGNLKRLRGIGFVTLKEIEGVIENVKSGL